MNLQLHTRGVELDHTGVDRRLHALLGDSLRSVSRIHVQVVDLSPAAHGAVVCTLRAGSRDREIAVDACCADAAQAITRACALLRQKLPRRRKTCSAAAELTAAGS